MASLRACLLLVFLTLTAFNSLATSLSFVGTGSYVVSGNTVVLRADKIQNNEFGGQSGTIRLELWAFSSPYSGSASGYKLASYVVGQLFGGYYYYNISSGSISLALPPPGAWYFSLQVREYTASGSDGYTTRDYINFSSPVRVAGGAYYGDEDISGLTSWLVSGNNVTLSVEKVSNICTLGSSGSLRLELWATTTPYGGGVLTGYVFGAVPLNPLSAGYAYNNIYQTVAYSRPPDGSYYVTLALSEYHNGSYVIVDYLTYSGRQLFGNPPPTAPTANTASSVTSSGFTANWSSTSGATGYRLDVSTSSTFSSYVSGYPDLDMGNVTSRAVSGLSAGITYYYRVRAYNSSGTSANSGTISVTTLPNLPSAPTATVASSVTSSGLTANWTSASGATSYQLDVSASSAFGSYVSGYQNLDVGNVTSRAVSGLNAGTIYYYRVRAHNSSGTSANSGTISATTLPNPPSAPTVSAASSLTASGFTANWSTVSGTTGYRLDVSTSGAFTTYVVGYFDLDMGNATSRTLSGLSAGTTYYYRVRAYNSGGTSGNSGTMPVTTFPTPPSAPTANVGSSVTGGGFTANWSGAGGATGYKLDVSTSSTFASYVTGYQDLDMGNVTSRAVSGLSAGTTYHYRVRAYNSGGTSANSATISVTTLLNPPSAPTVSAASGITSLGFTANWSTTSGATGYRLDVSTSSTFASFVGGYLDFDSGSVTSMAVSGLNAGTTYYYRVRAYNSGGTSANSSTMTATTALITFPIIGYSRQAGSLVVSWPTNFSGFTVESATNLPAINWTPNSASPSIINGRFTVTDSISDGQKFYRLRQ